MNWKKKNSVYVFVIILFFQFNGSVAAATREYWIAADEVLWDYAPSFPENLMSGKEFTEDQRVFVERGIGRQYLKSVYRKYTARFSELKSRGSREQHLGIIGPIIRAAVGDKVIVHFRNNTRFPASIHPHGVFYNKGNEGAFYSDGKSNKGDDIVAPKGEYTYQWSVPLRAGPGSNDPSSIAWIYHGHVDAIADTNAGLVGAIIITRGNAADDDGTPKDVDREFVSLFTVFDENTSLYQGINQLSCSKGHCNSDDEGFQESNLMHGINGLVYGNNQGYIMRKGERVRWYILGMGSEVDLHTPHWHGATLLHNGNRSDVVEILPVATKTLDMNPDALGTWMFHCHVNDHINAGMMTTFTVQ